MVEKTFIKDILIIKPSVFTDSRGYFFESFNRNRFSEHGLESDFIQDNVSKSVKGTIRGLHYQVGNHAQSKLCQVIHGKVLDVAVDIRFGSPTFGKHFSIELSGENKLQLWIPKGFAHGFSVLSDEAIFSYKCTAFYNKEDERTILFNDPDLAVNWKTADPVVSEKDLKGTRFREINRDFIYK